MDIGTATLILAGIRLLEDMVNTSKEPIVDSEGNVIAKDLKEYRLKSSSDIFKNVFGKNIEEIKKEIESLRKGGT